MSNPVDFSDIDEEQFKQELDAVISVLDRLSQLHTTTRMTVLATSFPALYSRIERVYALSKSLFEDQ